VGFPVCPDLRSAADSARLGSSPRFVSISIGALLVLSACGQVPLGSTTGPGGTTGAGASSGLAGAGGSGGVAGSGGSGGAVPDAGDGETLPGVDAGFYPGSAPPSCGTTSPCGGEGASCCEARRVPAGTYDFGVRDPNAVASLASVSELYLDTFEVTVARYRAFVADYDRWRGELHPSAGEGAHPRIAGSGWQEPWSERLPATSAALSQDSILCQGEANSTLAAPSAGEASAAPVNCVSWYEAFAFCIWDGGRLPTQAEWEHATTGGSEQRLYPWGAAPTPSDELAVFGCEALGEEQTATCASPGPPAVGSRPLGAGRWGHLDLAGSVSEWTFDAFGVYPARCEDCAIVDDPVGLGLRFFRGGSWTDADSALALGERPAAPAEILSSSWGLRCARDVSAQ